MKLHKIADSAKAEGFHCSTTEVLMKFQENGDYKFAACDRSGQLRNVDWAYYASVVYGIHYEKIREQLPTDMLHYAKTDGLNGDQYFSTYQNGLIHGFDQHGVLFYEEEQLDGNGHPTYDIKFEAPHFLWLAFPTGHTVAQYSIPDKKEVYRIGNYSWDEDEKSC